MRELLSEASQRSRALLYKMGMGHVHDIMEKDRHAVPHSSSDFDPLVSCGPSEPGLPRRFGSTASKLCALKLLSMY
jgi:hypothetical protein